MYRSPLEQLVLDCNKLPLCRILALQGFVIGRDKETKLFGEWEPDCAKELPGLSEAHFKPYRSIISDLDLLVRNRYIRALYQPGPNHCTYNVEIFLVPNDLDKLRSRILPETRSRSKATLPACKRALQALCDVLTSEERPLLYQMVKTDSLLDAWNSLPSPSIPPDLLLRAPVWLRDLVAKVLSHDDLDMLTDLYDYQRQDLAIMLFREHFIEEAPDVTYSKYIDARGKHFFMNEDCDILSIPGMYRKPNGGILAELPGSGKTLCVLALCFLTRNLIPSLSAQTTPLGLYPVLPRVVNTEGIDLSRSLLGTCVKKIRQESNLSGRYVKRIANASTIAETSARDLLLSTFLIYDAPDLSQSPSPLRRYSSRLGVQQQDAADYPTYEVLLTKTSLIVVPDVLLAHWEAELQKHIGYSLSDTDFESEYNAQLHDPSSRIKAEEKLRYRIFQNCKETLPVCHVLSQYNVLLFSERRFAKLSTHHRENPILQMHFARIIVDEAHFVAGDSRSVSLASLIRTNARWALSATPTKHLNAFSNSGHVVERTRSATIDNARDAEDVRKLGQICAKYLKMDPFGSDHHEFDRRITKPFIHRARGYDRINNVITQIIIRHSTAKIRHQIQLPPMTTEVSVISWAWLDRLSYNVLLALFTTNSILSEKAGKNYFFYDRDTDTEEAKKSSNKVWREQLLAHFKEAHMLFVQPQLIRSAQYAVQNITAKLADNPTELQTAQLPAILAVLNEALKTPAWILSCQYQDVLYSVDSCPFKLSTAYDVRNISKDRQTALEFTYEENLFPAYRVEQLREGLLNARRSALGAVWRSEADLQKGLVDHGYTRLKELRSYFGAKDEMAPDIQAESSLIPGMALSKKAHPRMQENAVSPSRKRRSERGSSTSKDLRQIPAGYSILKGRLLASSSSKLNWIIDEILASDDDDRFLIFDDSPLTLFTIAEAMVLASISHVYSLSGNLDGKQIGRFQNERKTKVMLMTPRQGARGHNITAANRIIFASPLFRPDDEAQAMLRSHRIGQTRPVRVQILVMQDSFEQAMLERRNELLSHDRSDVLHSKSEADDNHLRAKLENATFIPASTVGRVDAFKCRQSFPLFGDLTDITTDAMSDEEDELSDSEPELAQVITAPIPKRKAIVAFAEPTFESVPKPQAQYSLPGRDAWPRAGILSNGPTKRQRVQ